MRGLQSSTREIRWRYKQASIRDLRIDKNCRETPLARNTSVKPSSPTYYVVTSRPGPPLGSMVGTDPPAFLITIFDPNDC